MGILRGPAHAVLASVYTNVHAYVCEFFLIWKQADSCKLVRERTDLAVLQLELASSSHSKKDVYIRRRIDHLINRVYWGYLN